jgi:hypothetical protein
MITDSVIRPPQAKGSIGLDTPSPQPLERAARQSGGVSGRSWLALRSLSRVNVLRVLHCESAERVLTLTLPGGGRSA